MNLLDIAAIAFGIGALVQICWLAWRSGLLVRGQDYTNAERAEDDAQDDRDIERIKEATQPAPLTWDNAYQKRPHIRAGSK